MPVGASVNVSPVQDVVLASRQYHIDGKMLLELCSSVFWFKNIDFLPKKLELV